MPQAQITIDAIVGSNIDLPLNTLVQLNNNGIGGEVSYLWTILDQPPGAVDSLSNTSIPNPTLTPQKEGTYLLRLIVNASLPTEQTDSVVAAVRQLKTRNRIPAAGETTQADFADGWATDTNALLRRYDQQLADPGPVVCVNKQGSVITRGNVVRVTSGAVIKLGLPGQETVPGITLAPATTLGNIDELLLVVEGDVNGNTNVAIDAICVARIYGRIAALPLGAGVVGDTVFVSDTATLATTAGTNRRRAGSIMSVSGGDRDVWFDGVGGQDITPIDRRYLVYGPPSPLTNAVRVDGPGGVGAGNVSGGVPVLFKAADVGTVPLEVEGIGGGTFVQRWLTGGGGVIARMAIPGMYDPIRGGLEFLSSYLFNPQAKATSDVIDTLALVRRSATQTSALLQWYDELGNSLGYIAADGEINLRNLARILSVLDPITPQGVATKKYADELAYQTWAQNLVQNGTPDFAQRIGVNVLQPITVANTRTWCLDRWSHWISAATADCQVRLDQAFGDNVLSIYKLNTGAAGIIYTTQEIDRSLLDKTTYASSPPGGVPLKLSFDAVSAISSNATVTCRVRSGSTVAQIAAPPSSNTGLYTSGDYQEASVAVTVGRNTISIPARVGRGALSVQFLIQFTGSVAANTTLLQIKNVMLTVAPASMAAGISLPDPPFRRSGASLSGEQAVCKRFYQKSYELATAVGTATVVAQYSTSSTDVLTANGIAWALGCHPRFEGTMRVSPAVALWTVGGLLGTWTLGGGAQVSVAGGISTEGFSVLNNTGGPQNPGKGTTVGHWAADAEL